MKRIREEEKYWKETQGVFAIPTMFFNDESVVTGARKQDDYKALLKELLNL